MFADASNDVGLALEMLAPLPAFREAGRFLQLICVASVFKAACGVAGGATGAAITEHWAVDNNIADIGAKVGVFVHTTGVDRCRHDRIDARFMLGSSSLLYNSCTRILYFVSHSAFARFSPGPKGRKRKKG